MLDKGIGAPPIAGLLHAAGHAAIELLPLVASCDSGDIGGLSTAIGPDGLPSVFVCDGYRAGPDSPNAASASPHLVGYDGRGD